MTDEEISQIARLIVARLNQGWDSQAARLEEQALKSGADFNKLQKAIFDARYGD